MESVTYFRTAAHNTIGDGGGERSIYDNLTNVAFSRSGAQEAAVRCCLFVCWTHHRLFL